MLQRSEPFIPIFLLFVFYAPFVAAQQVLYSMDTKLPGLAFTDLASNIGDINGDGFKDFVIGSPAYDSERGIIRVFSGKEGKQLYSVTGASQGDRLGAAIAPTDDHNKDGRGDIIVGAPGALVNGIRYGAVYLFSGANGATILNIPGGFCQQTACRFGYSVDRIGDVNGDGVSDILIGDWKHDANPNPSFDSLSGR